MLKKYAQKLHKMTPAEKLLSKIKVGSILVSPAGKQREVIQVGANAVVFKGNLRNVCYTMHDLLHNNYRLYEKLANVKN